MLRRAALYAALLAMFSLNLLAQQAQDKSKRPSPPGTASVTLNGKTITIDYSRPKIRDPKTGKPRVIMGKLVPYGQVWRTGANEATSLKTDADIVIGDTKVPAGSYTLYSVPGENQWKLIINKQTGQWGTEYNQDMDLARVDMTVGKTSKKVDQFTISFNKKNNSAADLVMEWENTRATVPVKLAQ